MAHSAPHFRQEIFSFKTWRLIYAKTATYCFTHIFFTICAQARQIESNRIIQLKTQLPFTTGTSRVDCLNQITNRYVHSVTIKADSALVYGPLAIKEAERIGYKQGLCLAANLYANTLLQLSKPSEGLSWYRLSTRLAVEIGNDTLAASGYRGIGQALWYEGNFQQAIDTIGLSIIYFKKLKLDREISDATMTISTIYGNQGNYEKAFEIAQQALVLSEKLHDVANKVLSLTEIGKSYRNIGDYASALEYYKKANDCNPGKSYWCHRHLMQSMGDLYCDLQQFDSARAFYQQSFNGNPGSKSTQLRLAEYHFLRQQYDSAKALFTYLYDTLKPGGEKHLFLYSILGLAKIYLAKRISSMLKNMPTKHWPWQRKKNARLNIRNACELLASIYEALHQPALAYQYYKQYVQMKDAVLNDQLKGKLYEFRRIAEDDKQKAQIKLLEQEKMITQEKLRGNQLLRNILMGGLVLIAFLSLMVLGNISLKRKNEKLRNERIQKILNTAPPNWKCKPYAHK